MWVHFSEICYRHLPPLHAILQQKQTNLPRQFLSVRGSVYKRVFQTVLFLVIPENMVRSITWRTKQQKKRNKVKKQLKTRMKNHFLQVQFMSPEFGAADPEISRRKSAMAARKCFVDGARGPSLFCGGTEAK
jgi:uncharacterized DUF497 family protein